MAQSSTIGRSLDMVELAWHWWVSQLSSLVPFSRNFGRPTTSLFVEIDEDDVAICKAKRGKITIIERVKPNAVRPRHISVLKKAHSFDVAIPARNVFIRRMEFPMASTTNLRNVLRLQLDRLSPLDPNLVYFDYSVMPTKTGDKKVAVDLAIVRHETINHTLSKVKAWSVSPTSIGIASSSATAPVQFNFIPEDESKRDRLPTFQLNFLLVLLLIPVLSFTWSAVQERWARDVSNWQGAIAQAKKEAQVAADIQQELDKLEQSRLDLIQKKVRPSLLTIMTELARLLPQNAWLSDLRLEDKSLRIVGFAENAALLPGTLEESPLFTDVRFHSPVRKDARQNAERFDLKVSLESEVSD